MTRSSGVGSDVSPAYNVRHTNGLGEPSVDRSPQEGGLSRQQAGRPNAAEAIHRRMLTMRPGGLHATALAVSSNAARIWVRSSSVNVNFNAAAL